MSESPKRVMIVEDQRLIAADLEATLRKLGYDVVVNVASGEEAVERAHTIPLDLVLMDIHLRDEMDGIQAAAQIRSWTDVPIIYLTAYADEETIARAKATEPFGYLVKPFNERELRAAIEVALHRHATERLLIEERARRRAAEEFKLLVDSVTDYAIFILDRAGRVASWNEGAARIIGYGRDEIIGQHISIFYPRDADASEKLLEAARQGGRAEHEGWRVRKDGTRFWAHTVITQLRNGSADHGYGAVTRDLTERKRNADALQRSEALFRSLFELAATGMGVVDPETQRFVRVNAKLEEITGYSAEELGRMSAAEIAHPDDRDAELGRWLALVDGPSSHPDEVRLIRGDGAMIWALINRTAIRDESGRATLCVTAIQDITALKHTEERLRDAVHARDEFLQNASHELKTPLTPLQLQLDSLAFLLGRAGVQSEQLERSLEVAGRQTKRLADLVEALLDVSRISSGRVELQLERVDVTELVRELVERFRCEASRAGADIVLHASAAVMATCDPLRVEQIVSNLLSNAIKYGGGNPIDVVVSASDADQLCVSVSDHGMGIAEEALGRIFERFERAASSRHFGGLGLGLFIARQFAEAHGGAIRATSTPGDGSTFTLVLPRQARSTTGLDTVRA